MKQLVVIISVLLTQFSFGQSTDRTDLNYIHFIDTPIVDVPAYSVKKIQLHGYLKIEYVEQGDSTGVPVIFLHSITDSWHSFEPILPHLSPSIHAYVLSQRGHGNSDKPVVGYKPENFADDVAEFMDLLQIRTAVIVGHAMGATVAQAFAIKYPQHTAAVVMIGSFAGYKNNSGIIDLQRSIMELTNPVNLHYITDFQESAVHRNISDTFLDTVVNESSKLPTHVWRGTINGLLQQEFTTELKKIKSPVLLVWGERDQFVPFSDQKILHDSIAGSRLVTYPETGHAVHWEEPARFANDLLSFITEVIRPPMARKTPGSED